jgi:tetratricopeptide (TPR) repeat protein
MAWSSAMNGYFDQATHRYQTAIELNESDPWTINSAALGLAYCGETALAADLIDRSLDLGLEPSNYHWAYQGAVRFLQGDYRKAVDAYKADDVIADLAAWKAASLAHLGRTEEAGVESRRFLEKIRARWHGEEPASEEAIASWLLHCFPIHDREPWERLRDGVKLAGLAVPSDEAIPRRPSL